MTTTIEAARDKCYRTECPGKVVGHIVVMREHGGRSGIDLPVCDRHAMIAVTQGRTVRRIENTDEL